MKNIPLILIALLCGSVMTLLVPKAIRYRRSHKNGRRMAVDLYDHNHLLEIVSDKIDIDKGIDFGDRKKLNVSQIEIEE